MEVLPLRDGWQRLTSDAPSPFKAKAVMRKLYQIDKYGTVRGNRFARVPKRLTKMDVHRADMKFRWLKSDLDCSLVPTQAQNACMELA